MRRRAFAVILYAAKTYEGLSPFIEICISGKYKIKVTGCLICEQSFYRIDVSYRKK